MDTQRLKDKILQLAIQGKLVEQDPNDEPASILLEKIKEEKNKLVKENKIRKPRKLAPITEDEKPFEIPESWEWVRLGDVANFINGDRGKNYPSKNELVESGIPFINAGHLKKSTIDLTNMNYITNDKYLLLRSGKVKINDIIYCLRGTLGKCAINKSIEKGAIASSLVIIRSYKNIHVKYLYYYLVSPLGNLMIKRFDNGTAQPNLSARKLKLYILPLPPLTEQKRIVEKVDQLFAIIDELDSNKEDLLKAIKLTRNQVLQKAMQGKLVEQNPEDEPANVLLEKIKKEKDRLVKEKKIRRPRKLAPITKDEKPFEIPKSWEWVRLGEIGTIVGGGTPRTTVKEYWENGNIPWLTPADLSGYNGKYISHGLRFITELGLQKSSAKLMPKGTVLFSSRAPIGYTAIAKNKIATNQGFKSCVPFIMKMNKYIYYYLTYSAELINQNASGTTFKEVSGAVVSNLPFPLPPLAEQRRIVEKVDKIMSICDKLEEQIDGENK